MVDLSKAAATAAPDVGGARAARTTRAASPAPPALPAASPAGSPERPRRLRHRPAAGPLPTAEHALAARAAEVATGLASAVPPAPWGVPGFAGDVDLVRRQLGPLRDRRMLVASYERESARLAALRRIAADPAAPPSPLDPIEAAYAVRWLELADGATGLPSWADMVRGGRRAAG